MERTLQPIVLSICAACALGILVVFVKALVDGSRKRAKEKMLTPNPLFFTEERPESMSS